MTVLAVDVGSSSVKAAVLRSGRVVGRIAREAFRTRFDAGRGGGPAWRPAGRVCGRSAIAGRSGTPGRCDRTGGDVAFVAGDGPKGQAADADHHSPGPAECRGGHLA